MIVTGSASFHPLSPLLFQVTGNKDFAPRFGPSGDEDGTGNCTLTVTPTLWSLLNVLPKNQFQMPHRHQSVALDFCVYAKPKPEGGRSSITNSRNPLHFDTIEGRRVRV